MNAASRSIAEWFSEFSRIAPQCELTRGVIFSPILEKGARHWAAI
jgi:hypothetical protein